MFKQDQARIERWCKNPDKLLLVGTMVLLSIRQPWVNIGNQMVDVKVHGSKSRYLWGFKQAGYRYMRDHRAELYQHVKDYRAGKTWLDDLMREFMKVPGLGLAKAGFMCQLLTGDGGCIDSHNLKRFGLDAKFLRLPELRNVAKQIAAVDDKINAYLYVCVACGDSEYLWDSWCEHLNDIKSTYENAEDVSRRHWIYLLDYLPGDHDDDSK